MLVSAYVIRPDLIKPSIGNVLIGLLAGPISELLYLRDYWHPASVLAVGDFKIEDAIFGASIIGLCTVIYPLVNGKSLTPPRYSYTSYRRHLNHLSLLLLPALTVLVLVYRFDINSVIATSFVALLLVIILGWIRTDILIPGLISGAILATYAIAFYAIALNVIAPHALAKYWDLYRTSLGVTIFGSVPLTELAFFFSFGALLPMIIMFTSGAAYIKRFR